MNRSLALPFAAALLGLAACRTAINPVPDEGAAKHPVVTRGTSSGPAQCDVRDFAGATDVPTGAKNLGWVQVPREKTDEETYLKLRQAICDKGGDALSSLAWVKEVGDREPTSLKANAWQLP